MHSAVTNQGLRTPLNPILGETSCYHTAKGSAIYLEQTSHHPPITHILMEGPPQCPF
jgi:hypothetical protein